MPHLFLTILLDINKTHYLKGLSPSASREMIRNIWSHSTDLIRRVMYTKKIETNKTYSKGGLVEN